MNKLRLLLMPFAAVVELLMLVVCWVVAVVNKNAGEKVVKWSTRKLPNISWYMGQ